MSQTSRIPFRVRGLRAAAALTYAAALATVLVGPFAAARRSSTASPSAAADDGPPAGAAANRSRRRDLQRGLAGHPLFEDQRPRNIGDILTIVITENINASKTSGANAGRNGSSSLSVPTAGRS